MPTDRNTRSVVKPSKLATIQEHSDDDSDFIDLSKVFSELNIDDDYDVVEQDPNFDDSSSWMIQEVRQRRRNHEIWAEKERLMTASQQNSDLDDYLESLHKEGFTNMKEARCSKYARKGDGSRKNKKELRRLQAKLRSQRRSQAIRDKNDVLPDSQEEEVLSETLDKEPAEADLRREERRKLAHIACDTPPQDIRIEDSEDLSQLLESIHDIAGTESDEEGQLAEWTSHLENLVIMAYQVGRADSFVDVFVAVVAYIKMNTNKSVIKQLMTLIDEVTTQCPKDSVEPDSWSGADVIQAWDLFKTNTIFKKVSYLLSAAMSLSVCTIKEVEWSPFGLQLIAVEAAKEQLKAKDVIDAVINTFAWCADVGYRVFEEKSLVPLLYSDNRMRKFNEECDYVLANAEQALAGNLGDINDFDYKVDNVLRQVCELKQAKDTGPTALWLQQRYSQLIKIKHEIVGKHRNTAIRFAPFGVGITGPSGVGKSTLAKIVMKVALHSMGFETDPSRIITKDMFDKYDSTYTSDILGLFMDDVGNGKAEFTVTSPSDVIIKFFNNMAAQAVKAELNAKGVVFIAFKVGVLTSNFEDYNIRLYTLMDEAALRRFVHTRARIKPKYRKTGSVSLNTEHPDLVDCDLTHDVWELDLEEVFIYEDKKGHNRYKFRTMNVRTLDGRDIKCKNMGLQDYLDVIISLAQTHKRVQEGIIKRSNKFDKMTMCDHCFRPTTLCKCAVKPDSFDAIGDVIVEAAKSSFTSYINQWFSPVYFMNSLIGYRPIKRMATRQLEGEFQEVLNDTVTPWMVALTPDWLFRTTVFKKSIDWWQHSAAMYDMKRQVQKIVTFGVFVAGYGIYDNDPFTVICALVISWIVSMCMWAQYRARIRHYKEEYMRRRDALPECAKHMRDGNVAKGAFVASTLVVGLKLFRLWNDTRKEKIDPDTADPEEEVEGQPGWFGFMMNRLGVKVDRTPESRTATCDQIVTTLQKNLFFANFERGDGSKTRCNIFFPRKYVALIPRHVFYPNADLTKSDAGVLTVHVHRHAKSGGQFSFKCELDTCGVIEELDLVAVHVKNCPDLPTQTKWLPTNQPKGSSLCKLVARTIDDTKVRRVRVDHGVVGHKYMDFYGGSYTTELARTGACMAPLVLDHSRPTIVGFHIGGDHNKHYGVMQTVTVKMIETLIKDLEEKSGFLSAESTDLPDEQYGRPLIESKDVHPHCMAARLGPEAFIDVLGSTRLRAQQKSSVQKSPLSDSVAAHFAYPNIWGAPKLRPNWKGFNATLEHIVNPADMFAPSELERARQDWLEPLIPLMREHMVKEDFRPLTEKESILGQDGKRFMTPLPMDTGMGFPIFGKKSKHFIETREGEKLIDRVPDEHVRKEMDRMMECWTNGKRAYPVTSATLKDEPTPVDVEKVRVFQASAVAMGIYIRKYFLPIARFLGLHPLVSESAVGVNAFGKEWEDLMDHAKKFAPDGKVIAWDYSKYDVRMNSQVTYAVWQSFIDLAEAGGYPQDALYIMKMMIGDIIHPLMDYNGTMIMAYNMNTSGNNMTVNVNSTAGSFYVRLGFFHVFPTFESFRKFVAALTYGDDFEGSVKDCCRAKFNFFSFQKYMAEHGIKVTLPDKSDDAVAFMDEEDADFLKRQSNYIPEIGCSIGRLAEGSIMKSLHSNLKSSSTDEMVVATSCIETAMHEWFAHGREVYDDRRSKMLAVCKDLDLPVKAVYATFDERVAHWQDKYCKGSIHKLPLNNWSFGIVSKSKDPSRSSVDTIVPQASDDAKSGVWPLFISATAYVAYALFKEMRTSDNLMSFTDNTGEVEPQSDEVDKRIVDGEYLHVVTMSDEEYISYNRWLCLKEATKPQSEEVQTTHMDTQPISMGPGSHTEQNVKFIDTQPGYILEEKANFDPVRDHALESDATLDEFFQRPIKIASYDWPVNGAGLHEQFNPWALYFENPRVINRISNYKLMRSKLHIKATISGNGFHYGRCVLTYNPFPDLDTLTVDRTFVERDFVAASQRPHIYLDPTNSQGGELILPFFYYKNVLDITESDWQGLGELVLADIQGLKHANGATDTVTINIFAWAEEAKFAIPTNKEPSTIIGQSDEYGKGAISRVAGVVAAASGKLTSIPPIAPFARATEIGASALGALATLFGYSRPVQLEHCQYRPNTKGQFAVTNAPDDVMKLTVDQKQELSIDPRTAGLDNVDELGINYIAGRESYFTQFDWAVGTGDEQLLYNVVVDPGIFRVTGDEYHVPACSFAALPFKYWRGSMKFRFQVVCSKYHKGRMKIVYDPCSTAADAEYNTAYTTIVDIADTTDFTVTVGWGQATTYRPSLPIAGALETNFSNTSALSYDASTATYGNGTLSVYVVNELTVPNTTVDNDISINVFVSMGDDFEVAVPDSGRFHRVRFSDQANVVQPQSEEVLPHSDEGPNDGDETDRMDSKPHHAVNVNTMSALTTLSDQTNHIHFGESIRSFRQLLKRYTIHELPPVAGTTNAAIFYRFRRHLLPFEPGYTASFGSMTNTVNVGTTDDQYVYGFMTLPRYLSAAYGGWKGGMRYVWDFSRMNANTSRTKEFMVASILNDVTQSTPDNISTVLNDTTTLSGKGNQIIEVGEIQGFDGMTMQAKRVNPTLNFEVPYYSEYRFTPAKQRTSFDSGMFNQPMYNVVHYGEKGDTSDSITSYVAAAEDFTCYMFLGAPIIYYEGFPPTS